MAWVMEVLGGNTIDEKGRLTVGSDSTRVEYLAEYDLEFGAGVGMARFTTDKSKALRWHSQAEVLAAWRERSYVKPVRDDGQPNRPLTALTISPVEVDE